MNNIIYLNGLQITNVNNSENTAEIEGYAAHFNSVNLNNQIVNAASFDAFFEMYNSNKLKPRFNYEHTDQLIGGIDELTIKEDGLYMKAHLTKNVKVVSDTILPLIESGDLNSFSTEGYISDIIEFEDGSYYIKNFMLTGVSIVSRPADINAKFSLNAFLAEYKQEKQNKIEEVEQQSKWYLL